MLAADYWLACLLKAATRQISIRMTANGCLTGNGQDEDTNLAPQKVTAELR